jgi:uncharacterized protein (TIGR02588 family)
MSAGDESGTVPQGQQEQGRSAAERTTFAISIAVLVALVGLITYLYLVGGGGPAVIEVRPQMDAIRQEGDAHYLPVHVTNRGDRTVEDVRVALSLTDDAGVQESGEVTFRFLAGGETGRATVVFRGDPARGTLASVVSYLEP